MDINQKLDAILKKHNRYREAYLKDALTEIISTEIKKLVEKYGEKIVVRGISYREDGKYALCELLNDIGVVTAVCDRKHFSDRLQISHNEIPFFDSKWMPGKEECDIYLINATQSGTAIYDEVIEKLRSVGIYVIDLYEMIRTDYSYLCYKLYDELHNERDYTWYRLWKAKKKFEENRTVDSLGNILGESLSLRDFVTFFHYCKEEKELVENDVNLSELKQEVDIFLEEIRQQMNTRREKGYRDILWHWIDSVRYEERCFFPKVSNRLSTDGIVFENAYTHTPYTTPTLEMIFWQEYRGGSKPQIKIRNSRLYQIIQDFGYKMEACGYLKGDINIEDDEQRNQNAQSNISSIHYFEMLSRMINADKPIVGIVQVVSETHEPFMSPGVDLKNVFWGFHGLYENEKDRIKTSANYADEVIDFYSNLFGNRVCNIYMSDHGKWEDYTCRRYKDESIHTILGVTNLGVCGQVKRLFCYSNFYKLIQWIIDMLGEEEMFISDAAIYSDTLKRRIVKATNLTEEICSGFQGINSVLDKYIRLDNGTEHYYLKSEKESIDHIDDEEYQERISELRSKAKKMSEMYLH